MKLQKILKNGKGIIISLTLVGFRVFESPVKVTWAKAYSYYEVITQRNIFKPRWELKTTPDVDLEKLAREKEEERKKQEEQKRQEELRQLEAKKQDLETNFNLSGVVFDGKNLIALITNRRTGGGSYRIGETLDGAKVVEINEKEQSVTLDYENKIKVILRLSINP